MLKSVGLASRSERGLLIVGQRFADCGAEVRKLWGWSLQIVGLEFADCGAEVFADCGAGVCWFGGTVA